MRLHAIAAVALGFAGLVVAAPAEADSLTYVKDHNVSVARPDGSAAHAVTSHGTATVTYRSPSMDDHGVIVAGHGSEIVRLRQSGAVLARFDPPPAIDSTGDPIDGVPQAVAVSPDGARIAFAYATYGCPPGAGCGARQVLSYSYADRARPWRRSASSSTCATRRGSTTRACWSSAATSARSTSTRPAAATTTPSTGSRTPATRT